MPAVTQQLVKLKKNQRGLSSFYNLNNKTTSGQIKGDAEGIWKLRKNAGKKIECETQIQEI